MQNECRKKYSQGIPQKEIANTGAGTLKFQKVFYIPLQDYKIPSDAKVDNPNKFILTLLFFLYIYLEMSSTLKFFCLYLIGEL